jgi:hypothetical protein
MLSVFLLCTYPLFFHLGLKVITPLISPIRVAHLLSAEKFKGGLRKDVKKVVWLGIIQHDTTRLLSCREGSCSSNEASQF